MTLSMDVKRMIAIMAVIALPACSSSDSDSDDTNVNNGIETGETEGTGTGETEGTETGETGGTGTDITGGSGEPNSALFGPAQYLISECGTLPISDTAVSNSLNLPAKLSAGEVVQGQIIPESASDNFHAWQVTLEAGNYHLLADTWSVSGEKDTLGLTITSLGTTTSENESLASDSEFSYDLRIYEFIEIQTARTLTLQVKPAFDQVTNYMFSFILNGSAVPSPTFSRCLPVTALSTETTETVTLQESEALEDLPMYSINLEERDYQIDASTSSVDQDTLGYTFQLLAPFGNDAKNILSDSAFDFLLTSSDTFKPDYAGAAWIRVENSFDSERTVEFTVSAP